MEMFKSLLFVATVTLAFVCVAHSKVVSQTTTTTTAKPDKWCMCATNGQNCKPCKGVKYMEDPKDKTKYFQCNHQCFDVMSCPKELIWNNTETTCVQPESSVKTRNKTSSHQSEKPTGKTTQQPSKHSTPTPQHHSSVKPTGKTTHQPSKHSTPTPQHHTSARPSDWCYCDTKVKGCRKCDNNTYMADENDDTKFYQCGAGLCFYHLSCQNNTVWNEANATCDHQATTFSPSTKSSTEHPSSKTTGNIFTVTPTTDVQTTTTTNNTTPNTTTTTTTVSNTTTNNNNTTTPSNHTTVTPSKTPASTDPPATNTTGTTLPYHSSSVSPLPKNGEKFNVPSFGGGIAAGIALAILLVCILYLVYYMTHRPSHGYIEC
ncbi:hypothetical protein Ahia01_000975600 [Argonauta hians]